ncbi:MAG TPA: MBL fold metallo-hydrolase [Actinospica sp.]|nr:MBL fold metallo-hydrolase [Actinospica sp.]
MTTNSDADRPRIHVLSTGGPTALIELGGLRFVTDPTFDEPQEYRSPSGATLTKTEPAALGPGGLGRVDAVLLSHDQHPDNLDRSGRAFLSEVPLVLTTVSGAGRLSAQNAAVPAAGLAPWDRRTLARPDGGELTVTAVPALHGPEGFEERTGEVTGFVLTAADLPSVYVSGDNASLDRVRRIAERLGPVDTAVLFAGAARLPEVYGEALLTLDGAQAAEAAHILGSRHTVVLHCDSWAHFSEDFAAVEAAFDEAGLGVSLSRTRHGRRYEV